VHAKNQPILRQI